MSQKRHTNRDRYGLVVTIPVKRELVRALIAERFGSIDEFVVEWEERITAGIQRTGRPRDRSTVYRWLDIGLSSRRDDVFWILGSS